MAYESIALPIELPRHTTKEFTMQALFCQFGNYSKAYKAKIPSTISSSGPVIQTTFSSETNKHEDFKVDSQHVAPKISEASVNWYIPVRDSKNT